LETRKARRSRVLAAKHTKFTRRGGAAKLLMADRWRLPSALKVERLLV
jgi:hypothetical protein